MADPEGLRPACRGEAGSRKSPRNSHCTPTGAMGIAGGLWCVEKRVVPSVSFSICRGAMGIAGGYGAQRPASPPSVSPQSRPVDGHSGPAGALHALFPTAARRQFSSGVGVQWELPGGVARRNQGYATADEVPLKRADLFQRAGTEEIL